MIGPPMGVLPMKATVQSAITRPRMAGSAASCSVALARAMNEMLTAPIRASATSARARLGATATAKMSTPNAALVEMSVPRP